MRQDRHGCRSPPIPSVLCSHRRLRQTHHQKPQIPPTIHPAPDGTHIPPAILPPTRCPDHTRATAYSHPPRHEATPTRSTARTYSPHAPTRASDHPGNRPSTTGYAGSDHPRRSTWKHPQIIRLCRPDADQITRPPYQDLASNTGPQPPCGAQNHHLSRTIPSQALTNPSSTLAFPPIGIQQTPTHHAAATPATKQSRTKTSRPIWTIANNLSVGHIAYLGEVVDIVYYTWTLYTYGPLPD